MEKQISDMTLGEFVAALGLGDAALREENERLRKDIEKFEVCSRHNRIRESQLESQLADARWVMEDVAHEMDELIHGAVARTLVADRLGRMAFRLRDHAASPDQPAPEPKPESRGYAPIDESQPVVAPAPEPDPIAKPSSGASDGTRRYASPSQPDPISDREVRDEQERAEAERQWAEEPKDDAETVRVPRWALKTVMSFSARVMSAEEHKAWLALESALRESEARDD